MLGYINFAFKCYTPNLCFQRHPCYECINYLLLRIMKTYNFEQNVGKWQFHITYLQSLQVLATLEPFSSFFPRQTCLSMYSLWKTSKSYLNACCLWFPIRNTLEDMFVRKTIQRKSFNVARPLSTEGELNIFVDSNPRALGTFTFEVWRNSYEINSPKWERRIKSRSWRFDEIARTCSLVGSSMLCTTIQEK